MADKEIFEYTYSAPQMNEVHKIRSKYLPKEMSKYDQLRALDQGVTKRGTAVALVHGVIFTLILGVGMSCSIVWAGHLFMPGVFVGCIGLAGVAFTYPIYQRIVKQDRSRIAPEILRLSEELTLGNE